MQKRADVLVSTRIRSAMRRAIREHKGGRSWEALVGYSLEDLMAHLESRFAPGMGWHNVAEWHIDHVNPLSSFQFSDFSDQAFRDAWALQNLQPLWAGENLKKGAKRWPSRENRIT